MTGQSYHIVLKLSGVKWYWHVEDDEMNAVKFGRQGDYHEACAAALEAYDYLVKQDMEATL